MPAPPARDLRLALAALTLLLCLLAAAMLLLLRLQPAPMATQSEMEQRAFRDGVARGLSPITQVTAISTTLGRLRPSLRCTGLETAWHALQVAARVQAYNPCDPATRLWVVELRGKFSLAFSAQPVRFIYTASGEYIRSEGGP